MFLVSMAHGIIENEVIFLKKNYCKFIVNKLQKDIKFTKSSQGKRRSSILEREDVKNRS